eukprot:COSAG02_NODE_5824_length_4012_cov_59.380199_2_plen_399_part_00
MDLWSHPIATKLRDCADQALTDANAALALRKAKLQEGGGQGKGGATTGPHQPATPTNRRRASGSQRSGSTVVRSGKKGDKVRVEPSGLALAAAESPAPQAPSALKGMNVRALRQRARTLGIDEDQLTLAVEGNDPKRVLIGLIQAKEAAAGPASTGDQASQTGGAEPATSSALKGMSVRSLRQRARELGIAEAELTAAVEGNDPKQELIKLIQAKDGNASAGPGMNKQADTALDTLPTKLRAALEELEAVDTVGVGDGESGGTIVAKQLNRMKQTYIADMSAVLSQVEAVLADPQSGLTAALGAGPSGSASQSAGEMTADNPAPSRGRVVSLLEGMEREILHNLLLGPLLPAESLAAISQTCRGLLEVVRSAEMQQYWAKHWVRSRLPAHICHDSISS